MKPNKNLPFDEGYRLGFASGLRLAGVLLGKTHTLKNGRLERIKKTIGKKAQRGA